MKNKPEIRQANTVQDINYMIKNEEKYHRKNESSYENETNIENKAENKSELHVAKKYLKNAMDWHFDSRGGRGENILNTSNLGTDGEKSSTVNTNDIRCIFFLNKF